MVHDTVAQKNFDPVLPPLPDNIDEDFDEESVKIVRLVKNKEPLVRAAHFSSLPFPCISSPRRELGRDPPEVFRVSDSRFVARSLQHLCLEGTPFPESIQPPSTVAQLLCAVHNLYSCMGWA